MHVMQNPSGWLHSYLPQHLRQMLQHIVVSHLGSNGLAVAYSESIRLPHRGIEGSSERPPAGRRRSASLRVRELPQEVWYDEDDLSCPHGIRSSAASVAARA